MGGTAFRGHERNNEERRREKNINVIPGACVFTLLQLLKLSDGSFVRGNIEIRFLFE